MENKKTKSMTANCKESKHPLNPTHKIIPTKPQNKFGRSSIEDGKSVLTEDCNGIHREIECLKCWWNCLPPVEGREIFGQKSGEILQHRSVRNWKGELSYYIEVVIPECKERGISMTGYVDTCRDLIGNWQGDWDGHDGWKCRLQSWM